MSPTTLFEKIWTSHVVLQRPDGWALLHIDRHLLHDLSGTIGFSDLAERRLPVRHPELSFATPDHAVSTAHGRTGETFEGGAALYASLKRDAKQNGIRFFDVGAPGHGIVHVMAPELGLVQPGITLICGDSHTCTNGGLGALAFGVGSSEITHALATQTLWQQVPRTLRVRFDGRLREGTTPKDLILYLIGHLGAKAGTGHVVEFAGSAIRQMSIEGRMTVCNLSIELGAKMGFVAPDDQTFSYLDGREFSPKGARFDQAVRHWRTLVSDDGARFDREVVVDASRLVPMVTWGTSPEQVIPIDGIVPPPSALTEPEQVNAARSALEYMGLEPGRPIAGTAIDWVFIGSCTNARLSDLQEAAAVVDGRRVAPGVTAWVVPGSEEVKREAEREGLHVRFRNAGFDWREPGCSMCVAANGEHARPGTRVASTSNRNFVGRQGPGVRTHLMSPRMAAAAALAGAIVDVRRK
ncbi:3-isopropylmalate dehydratase large subunit [Burkholderia metallica]|uniref:3-isopropylmalate dehydratase large subunit n=1 Tax=Burkholderia metallica TaxID=488729 RepID=UPI00157AF8C0|nr:3-isopropylmalate dehydratase large subunit [Burkholderia metallica]NTZ83628.1 3-isopropylmalate dehydratase large subunit [Burkholderia metallica]